MKRWINKLLIIAICMFLSVCSNKIRKREDKFQDLDRNEIREGNSYLKRIYEEWKVGKLLNNHIFTDASFLLVFLQDNQKFLLDKAKFSYQYDYNLTKVQYKCGASEPLESNLRDIYEFIKEDSIDKKAQEAIAQYIVLRKCLEIVYNCINFDSLCIIKYLASLDGLNMIMYKPGDHGLTVENIFDIDGSLFPFFGAIIPKEVVNSVILYSSNEYFRFTKLNPQHLLYNFFMLNKSL